MKNWVRRLRGAIGVGMTWAAAWFAAGMVLLFIVGFGAADVPFPLFFGFLGFLAGTTFSGILGLVARRRRFDQMSLSSFAGWGALGGVLLAGTMRLVAGPDADFLVIGPIFAAAGAICATGTLALARRGEEPLLLDSGDPIAMPDLEKEREREPLGERR